MSSKDIALENALVFFEGNELAATTYLNKYALKDKEGNYIETDPLQTIVRVSKVLADAMPEEKTVDAFFDDKGNATCKLSRPSEEWLKRVLKEEYDPFRSDRTYTWLEIFGKACNNFKGVCPQGSVLAAAGDDTRLQSLSNCFVVPPPSDTIAGIMQTNERMAQIFKRRGGCGTDLSTLRPDEAIVNNAALKSSGSVGWANHFSNTCRDVAQSGRRGAEMLTLNIKHPDSEKWAKMKEDLSYCTGANVSLWITDEFMKAVKSDKEFELKFPIDSDKPFYLKIVKARELWNTICNSAWKMAEPGILNYDHIVKTLPAHFYEGYQVVSTNPCCFSENYDVTVLTKRGLKEIKQITAEDLVWIDGESCWAKTLGYFKSGKAEVFKVTFRNGTELHITKNHKLLIPKNKRIGTKIVRSEGKLTPLKDLKVGSEVMVHTEIPTNVDFGKLGTLEEGYLLGWLTGDGCLSYSDAFNDFPNMILSFWNQEHDVAEKCLKFMHTIGYDHLNLTQQLDGKNKIKKIKTVSFVRHFTEKYEYNIWKFKKGKNSFLNKATKEFLKGYLSSYFSADGTVSCHAARSRYSIQLASIEKERLIQIKNVLLLFGIKSSIGVLRRSRMSTIRGKKYLTKVCYRLTISGRRYIGRFNDEIGFISEVKQKKLDEICNNLNLRSDKWLNYTTIKSIESIGMQGTGCIEVEGYHRFTAEGILSGNSEIPLGSFDACRLISIRLLDFVENPFKENAKFNFEEFEKKVRITVRMGEGLVEAENKHILRIIEKVEREQKEAPQDKKIEYQLELDLWKKVLNKGEEGRRLGLGDHGWADMFAQLGIKYDSEEAIKLAKKIKRLYRDAAYDESIEIAKEYGPFSIWDWEVEKDCDFFKTFPEDLIEKMKKYGRRHISLLTNAPTGSLSILGQCSSGIEPVFRHFYTRRRKINANDKDSRVDFTDQNGDKWQEFPVFERNVKLYFDSIGEEISENIKDEEELNKLLPDYFVTSDKIDWKKRIDFQSALTRHVDHSISSCLAVGENQYIYTNKGLVLIDDLVSENTKIKTFSNIKNSISSYDHTGNLSQITEGYNNGVAECLKITLADNTSIVCTENHKLFCLDETYAGTWKEAKTLTYKDIVIGRLGLGCFGNPSNRFDKVLGKFLPTCSVKGNYKEVNYPQVMSEELAFILGCLVSDGGFTINGIFLSQQGNNVLKEFEEKTCNLFKISGKLNKDLRSDNLYSYTINSRGLRDYVKYLGIESGAINKTVPRSIFKCADQKMVTEFIKGLTLDGYINKKGHNVYILTSISYNLIRQVKELLNQLGIRTNIVKTSESNTKVFPNSTEAYKTKESWGLYCNLENSKKFCTVVGFAETRKQQEAEEYILKYTKDNIDTSNIIPDCGLRSQIRESLSKPFSKELPVKLKSFYRKAREGMDISLENIQYLKEEGFDIPNVLMLTDPSYTFCKVINIEEVGKKLTYDLHVPINNSYTVNGIISHNTINLPEDVSVDTVKELYTYAWEKGLKGVTIYREGSRSGVLVSNKKEEPTQIKRSEAPKRPKKLHCEVHHTSVKGESYVVLVGLLNGSVYEVFFGKYANQIPNNNFSGYVERKKKGNYYLCFIDEELLEFREVDINEYFDNKEYMSATRLLSMALRHGCPLSYICEQLKKSSPNITEFGSAVSRILKKYIKIEDLQEQYRAEYGDNFEVRMEDGCMKIINLDTGEVESKCD